MLWMAALDGMTLMIAVIDRVGLPLDTKLGIKLRGTDNGSGLVIDMVVPGGLTEQLGQLQDGDRIISINDQEVVGVERNVIVGWLYEEERTTVVFERDPLALTPPPPKLTMKERLAARAAAAALKVPGTMDLRRDDGPARETSLKARLVDRRMKAQGHSPTFSEQSDMSPSPPVSEAASPVSFIASPRRSPVSSQVIVLGGTQTVEGMGAVHVVQVRALFSSIPPSFFIFWLLCFPFVSTSIVFLQTKPGRKDGVGRSGVGDGETMIGWLDGGIVCVCVCACCLTVCVGGYPTFLPPPSPLSLSPHHPYPHTMHLFSVRRGSCGGIFVGRRN
jgi:hypothetical protein